MDVFVYEKKDSHLSVDERGVGMTKFTSIKLYEWVYIMSAESEGENAVLCAHEKIWEPEVKKSHTKTNKE